LLFHFLNILRLIPFFCKQKINLSFLTLNLGKSIINIVNSKQTKTNKLKRMDGADISFVNKLTVLNLGQRIREIRKSQNKSLEELAKKVGITKAHLSQIERGKVNPSVNTLWSLADALNIPMSNFFILENEKKTHLKSIKAKFISDGVKCFSLYLPHKKDFEFTYIEYTPGSSTGKQLGKHGGIECVLVLDGKIKFTLGDREYILKKEQSIQFWGNIPHGVENIGKKVAKAIYIIFPEKILKLSSLDLI